MELRTQKALKLNTIFLNSLGYSLEIPKEVIPFGNIPIVDQNLEWAGSLTLTPDEINLHLPNGAGTLFGRTKIDSCPEIKYLVIGALGEKIEGTFAIATRITDGDAEECFAQVGLEYRDHTRVWNLDLGKEAYPLKWHFESREGNSEDLNIDWLGAKTKPGITYESKNVISTFHGPNTFRCYSKAILQDLHIKLTKGFNVNDSENVAKNLELPIYGSILSQQMLPRLGEDMAQMEPNYYDTFAKINRQLNGWLAILLDLCYPEFSDTEIRKMTGIDRRKSILQTEEKDLTTAYLGKKARSRIRY